MNRYGKRCVLYPRVSTEMQVDGYSLEGQKNMLTRFADREEMIIVDTYEDAGKSGKSIEGRPAFQKMLRDIEDGLDIDYILVYKLSRFGRNAADILNSLELVQSYGVNLICIEEGIDSSQTSGKLLISVLSAVAEIERENIIEQTMNGRREKARQGGWNGGFAPYGYTLEDNKLMIEETEAVAIRKIFELYTSSEIGLGGIANQLNLQGIRKIPRQNGTLEDWTGHFIKLILDNPVYCGKIAYGRRTKEKVKGTKNDYQMKRNDDYILTEGQHKGIVSEEVWEKAHAKRLRTGVKQPSKIGRDRVHLLSGLLKCPVCGSPMYTNKHAWTNKDGTYKEIYYYVCSRNRMVRGKHCEYKAMLKKTDIEPMVIEAIREIVRNEEYAQAIKKRIGVQIDTKAVDKELEGYQAKLKEVDLNKTRLEREIDSLPADAKYRERKLHDMTLRLDSLYDVIVELEEKIEDARLRRDAIKQQAITLENIYKIMVNFDCVYNIINDEEKRNVVTALIKEIEIYRNDESEYPLKRIGLNFPVFKDGGEVTELLWDKGNTVDSRDTVVIDSSVRDSAGHNWYDLFQQVTASDDDYIGKIGTHGFAYRTKDGNVLDKATWEWWWRNAVYYVCYDAPTDNADMDQVYFYIDEQGSGPKVDDKLEGASSASNPYSEYTFTYAGTYEVMLYGAGGGSMNSNTSSGGRVRLVLQAEQGAKLYFVKGGSGTVDNRYWENGGGSACGEVKRPLPGGYNGGGNGGTPMITRNGHGNLLGASGGGATTVAIGLMGTGRLAEYGNTTTAAQYMLGVAGGGGGNQHGALDSTGGYAQYGVPVNGGNGGGNGTFATGSSGGNFNPYLGGIVNGSSENCVEAPSGGGGGWQGGYANTGSKQWWGDGWAYCKRDGNGGSNYITSTGRTFTGSNGKSVTVLEAQSYVGTGATTWGGDFNSYQNNFHPGNGYATIKTIRSAVDRFTRNGHNAYDTAYEDTDPYSSGEPIRVTVNITVANKTYDGQPDVATLSYSGNLSSDQMTEVQDATSIVYSNKKGTQASAIDASTDEHKNARQDCGSYTATANCTAQGYIVTYKYENTDPGNTYPSGGASGTGSSVKFDIYPMALTVVGEHSKAYDHTANATIPDARITTGMAVRDSVTLNTTQVDGYYCDATGNRVSDAGGPYKIVRESELTLVGNGSTNYYIGTEEYSGSISARGLYVHSLYLEDPTNPRNIKHYDGTTNATIKDILIDGILEGDDVKLVNPIQTGKYKTKDAGQRLDADGKVSSNWPTELDENPITIDATPALTGKDAKNYYVERQAYSGAIARANLTAQVKNWRGLYGDGVGEDPWHDTKAYGYGTAASDGCWLELDGLVPGDFLTLDPTYTKSHFKTLVTDHEDLVPDETTPVGVYPLTYVGLTEDNYDVLKNYIVMVLNGRFEVAQRPLHVTVVDDDKLIYQQNPNFHVNIQMEDVDENLIDVVSDVDATPILDTPLKANDTVSSVLYLDNNGTESAITQEFVNNYDYWKKQNADESKTNLPFVTDCDEKSLPLYVNETDTDDDFEWAHDKKTCGFCDYNHKPLAPYVVDINTDPTQGNALTVRSVTNPNGETVKNYDLIIHKGNLYVHPALLKATVPLYVCMYGSNSSGAVVEPTNYRITNYSTVAIQVKNIKTSGPWTVKDVPGMEYYTGTDYGSSTYTMSNNTLHRGELYMRLRDKVLTDGDNAIDHSDTAWVIPKATGDFLNNKITGTAMRVPMAVYTATGNVNDANVCTPVTKVTYTIAPYGGTMPDEAEFEKVDSQDWLKDAS